MPNDATRRAHWCDVFAKLYAAHEQCSREHARVVARMLYPSLNLLTPAQAMQMLSLDTTFVDAMRDAARRSNGES